MLLALPQQELLYLDWNCRGNSPEELRQKAALKHSENLQECLIGEVVS